MTGSIINSLEMAFAQMWAELVMYLPVLVVALVVLIVGVMVAAVLKKAVIKIFATLKVNEALDMAGVDRLTERAGYRLDAGLFVGTLVKWFVVLVFFVVALDILGLTEVTIFLREVVINYLPRVIVAVLILMVSFILAGMVRNVVASSMQVAGVQHPQLFGKVAYFAILVVAVLAALNQLQIAQELVQMLFAGMVFAASLALGLAFGFGGRETAARYLDRLTK